MEKYFSIKMRSSFKDVHLSGAERIVKESEIEKILLQLYKRGKNKSPDNINIKIEEIKKPLKIIEKSLKIKDIKFRNYQEANQFAVDLLCNITGLNKQKINKLINLLHTGASPSGNNMRGAMIVDIEGNRLEIDKEKGIRTTEMDFLDRENVLQNLLKEGYTDRTVDALVLTTKNLAYPDIIAEYCISDEPNYLTGYVSTKETYYRLTPLKEKGSNKGGRVYFVKKGTDINKLYEYLTKTPVLVKEVQFD